MLKTLAILLLLCSPAIAATADQPLPAQAAALEKVRVAIEQAKVALQAAADAHQAQADLVASQPPVSPDAAPVVVQGPIETKVSIPAQIRDDLVSLMSLLITGMIGVALAWGRSHLKFMKNVGMNQEITTSAQDFGAILVQDLKQNGLPTTVDIHSPQVAALTQRVIDNYPGYVAALGITPDKIATLVLKGAAKVLSPIPAAAPHPVVIPQAQVIIPSRPPIPQGV